MCSRFGQRSRCSWALCLFGLCFTTALVADSPIKVKTFGPDRYASFVQRWDEGQSAISLTAIDSLKSWNLVFGAAAVMGNRKPFAPEAAEFDEGLLLVIAQQGRPPVSDRVLRVEKVTRNGLKLKVAYRFQNPEREDTFSVIHSLGIWVPREDWESIEFIENDKSVGTLEPGKGKWAIPAREPESETP